MDTQTKQNVDTYLRGVVAQHTPVITYNIQEKMQGLLPHIYAWANGHKYDLKLSGSFAKGTAITGTTDIDLFISLHPSAGDLNTLEFVYQTLRNRFTGAGYQPREQNVSLGIQHGDLKIDIVPGVRYHPLGNDHSLWKRKAQTHTKSNIDAHINHVIDSKRVFDIKAIKIWRKLRNLDFPSFYLELSVIEALKWKNVEDPSGNFAAALQYLSEEFTDKTIHDPSNQSNKVSDELTVQEKQKIKIAAQSTLRSGWEVSIW